MKNTLSPTQRGLLLLSVAYCGLWGFFYFYRPESASLWLTQDAGLADSTKLFGILIMLGQLPFLAVMLYPRALGKLLIVALVLKSAIFFYFQAVAFEGVWTKQLIFHASLNEGLWIGLFLWPAFAVWFAKRDSSG